MNASNYGVAKNLTGTGTVNAASGRLLGFYVNSTTAGTIALDDGGTTLTGTITPAIGWHWLPLTYSVDLGATLGGTIDVTFVIS